MAWLMVVLDCELGFPLLDELWPLLEKLSIAVDLKERRKMKECLRERLLVSFQGRGEPLVKKATLLI